MRWVFLLLIFVFTLVGGGMILWFRGIKARVMGWLLAFAGAFLLGITLLHLMPESFEGLGEKAGLFIFLGFFIQLFLQQWSQGLEHGHVHDNKTEPGIHHKVATDAFSIVLGLSVHAFMAGLPLGFNYSDSSTLPALSLGILLHKIPEAATLMVMLLHLRPHKKDNILLLFLFALVTPGAAALAYGMNIEFQFMAKILLYIIAIVTGAFLHISTTIFFESGAKHHELNQGKVFSMFLGFGLAALTLFL